MPFQFTASNSVLFLGIFILAFFPDLFIGTLRAPSALLAWSSSSSSSTTAKQASIFRRDPVLARAETTAEAPRHITENSKFSSSGSSSKGSSTTHSDNDKDKDSDSNGKMSWFQKTFTLPARSRGSYLITDQVESALPEIKTYRVGILHLFAQHTSCALSLNENWDEDVRADMSDALDRIAPEDKKGNLYRHGCEGPDDMPAHVKSALVGASVSVPITNGRLATGTWQGIWYLEFRAAKHSRKLVATIQGEKM